MFEFANDDKMLFLLLTKVFPLYFLLVVIVSHSRLFKNKKKFFTISIKVKHFVYVVCGV
jgi:hypothetical protein